MNRRNLLHSSLGAAGAATLLSIGTAAPSMALQSIETPIETWIEIGPQGDVTHLRVEAPAEHLGERLWAFALQETAGGIDAFRGARPVLTSTLTPGWSWEIPAAAFGSVSTLGVVLRREDGTLATATVALPPQSPTDPVPVPPDPGSVVVTEYMKDPAAVTDARGEWFEIENRTDQLLDLEGWTLRDLGSNRTVLGNGGAGILIRPFGRLVLGRNIDPAENGGIPVDVRYSGFSLGNGADQIVLDAPGGFEVTRLEYGDGPDWPDEPGRSAQLAPSLIGTSAAHDATSWCVSTSPLASGDFGTPGAANVECP